MRKILASTSLAAAALLLVPVGATASDTTVSFTVAASGSGLSVSQAGGTASLASGGSNPVFDALAAGTVTGSLPATTVTDQRGTLLGAWTVNVSGTDFVNGADATVTVARSNARVYLDAANLAGLTTTLGGALSGMTLTSAELTAGTNNLGSNAGAGYTLIAGTTAVGNGSVTYTPAMQVTVPAATPAGTYTATVTQTVS
ncbi:MAG: hypothetical protein ACLGIR_12220 [Actinomycetes bacterium]